MRYVFQCFLGGLSVAAALVFFDVVSQPVIIASFGASAFIAFAAPSREYANARHMIGGYVIGVAIGCLVHMLIFVPAESYIILKGIHIFAAALAVMISMFIMTITNMEHPPAASIALGFVVNDWTYKTVIFVLIGITIITLIKYAFRNHMTDLVGAGRQ